MFFNMEDRPKWLNSLDTSEIKINYLLVPGNPLAPLSCEQNIYQVPVGLGTGMRRGHPTKSCCGPHTNEEITHLPSPQNCQSWWPHFIRNASQALDTIFGDSPLLFSVLFSFYIFFLIISFISVTPLWGKLRSSQKRCVGVLTPSTSAWNCIWKSSLYKGRKVTVQSQSSLKSNMTVCLQKGKLADMTDTDTQGKDHVKIKAEIGVKLPQPKDHQRWPPITRGEKPGTDSSSCPSEGSNPAPTFILHV